MTIVKFIQFFDIGKKEKKKKKIEEIQGIFFKCKISAKML